MFDFVAQNRWEKKLQESNLIDLNVPSEELMSYLPNGGEFFFYLKLILLYFLREEHTFLILISYDVNVTTGIMQDDNDAEVRELVPDETFKSAIEETSAQDL